jgi:hypothetical protein
MRSCGGREKRREDRNDDRIGKQKGCDKNNGEKKEGNKGPEVHEDLSLNLQRTLN